jgi:hypothetical protein
MTWTQLGPVCCKTYSDLQAKWNVFETLGVGEVVTGQQIKMSGTAIPSRPGANTFDLHRWPANWLRAANIPSKGVSVAIQSLPSCFVKETATAAGDSDNGVEPSAAAQQLCEYAAQQADLDIHLQVRQYCH